MRLPSWQRIQAIPIAQAQPNCGQADLRGEAICEQNTAGRRPFTTALGLAMRLVDELMQTAEADTEVLRSLDSNGDRFAILRDVDFLIRAVSRENAEIIAGFINEFSYGIASVQESEGEFSVLVIINMPVTQQVILSVSGFMVCVARLFGAAYDGWGCAVAGKT